MKKQLNKVHEHYREHYFNEEIANRIKDRVHHDIRNTDMIETENKQRRSITKKISYASVACLVLFGLFIGSAFVSPAIAEVVSKIPFLNTIFVQKPIHEVLIEKLKDKGYDISGTGYSVQEKTYFVTVTGSEEYYNQVKAEIKKITDDVISSRGYDDFKIKVRQERTMEPGDDSVNDHKYRDSQLALDVLNEVVPQLQQQGYKIHTYGGGYTAPDAKIIRLDLDIEDTEKRTAEIEKTIIEGIEKQDIQKEVVINFYPFNVQEKEIENKWTSNVLPVIWEGMLSKKEYKTKGAGYSYKKGTMNIFITTTIDESDSEAPELTNKIEMAIHEFLQSDDLKDIVGDTPYKIVVSDKDGKEIN
ncbi:DUF4030 domain-containing protein [Lederbergia panacisoli]|uniref:DUF4030 domain-containing protein n=1 Tax=Lederbergia panacisoli TaxID=1255251 RepID=UPI00214B68D0|nr:DUF4030 domain-containing protein [Lederbergia panacisoli]MCR2821729.1 DUF4030 domain-containing protein [Lederbergia panacisoli]